MQKDSYTLGEKMIDVGKGHQLYTQLWGNADAAETIVFLHGGPGSGCKDTHKQSFDPERQRVLFFDQRGAGKSLPYGSLEHNTTDDLVADITKVTAEYGVDRFALTGGSWGSCLALVYGIRNPDKVTRMVLRGIFTGRQSEIDFIDKGEVKAFFPEVWERFTAVPQTALTYADLENSVSSLDDRAAASNTIDPETFDPTGITIESHYTQNRCFLPDRYVLDNAGALTMPVALVQGRYDMVCPPATAYELHKALPDGRLYWTIAGHSGSDRANFDTVKALLAAIA